MYITLGESLMNQNYFYLYMQKQVILLMLINLLLGAIYVFTCWIHDVIFIALAWYCVVNVVCLWGWSLYLELDILNMTFYDLNKWYNKVRYFMYIIFGLWSMIFILYV